ncbi:reverse transcriptase domain-containing protein [Tanacetum coccineum]|uniref:Reverse transcriptase domain-containing protein n=1 Tax=Tanacetum coccineum TaxID=301880 RepID=A0ABQ5E231_9ASTR
MTIPVKKRNHAKFYEFHGEVGHNADECMHLKKQIEEIVKAGKLSHFIKELKQNNGKEQPKVTKKGETSGKDKALAILMVQPWERVAKQRITQSFSPNPEIFFPPLGEDEGTEGPMIIEAEIRGHCIHRMYIGDEEHSASAWMNFIVVRSSSPYNGIIGRPGVRKLQVVPSIAHGMLKILVEGGVITLKSSKLVPLECAVVSGPKEVPSATKPMIEERIKTHCGASPKRAGGCSLVRQKKRGQAADRNQVIQEEVGKLIEAGIMKEVHYHDWLSNPIMTGRWNPCGDSLSNAFWSATRKWQMAKEDEEKTTFITSQGIFCYTKMPFGLRNARATYQRLVDKAFHKQIGINLEVYVDDLVIKSRTKDEIVRDIEETFKTLREINMKLNPKKYTFGVEEGMFLGYKVNSKGLKVCPDKVDILLSLPSPKCLKDVQKLNGKLISLNRFLAKSAEKSLPFFKTLKKCTKKSNFHWTMEAEEAFKK